MRAHANALLAVVAHAAVHTDAAPATLLALAALTTVLAYAGTAAFLATGAPAAMFTYAGPAALLASAALAAMHTNAGASAFLAVVALATMLADTLPAALHATDVPAAVWAGACLAHGGIRCGGPRRAGEQHARSGSIIFDRSAAPFHASDCHSTRGGIGGGVSCAIRCGATPTGGHHQWQRRWIYHGTHLCLHHCRAVCWPRLDCRVRAWQHNNMRCSLRRCTCCRPSRCPPPQHGGRGGRGDCPPRRRGGAAPPFRGGACRPPRGGTLAPRLWRVWGGIVNGLSPLAAACDSRVVQVVVHWCHWCTLPTAVLNPDNWRNHTQRNMTQLLVVVADACKIACVSVPMARGWCEWCVATVCPPSDRQ